MAETGSARSALSWAHRPQIARGVLVLVACVLCTTAAIAEPELSLSWTAPEACPDRAWAMQRIAAQLARKASRDVAEGVRVSVTIERQSRGFGLSLRASVADALGERAIEGESCKELAEAATLIIALSVSEASERGPQTSPPGPQSSHEKAPAPKAQPAKQEPHVQLFALRADALLDVGFLDPLGYGPAFSVAYQRDVWRAELGALWIAPRVIEAKDPRAGGVQASLWAVRGGGCALLGKWRIQGGPCAGAEFGRASGEGRGELQSRKRAHLPSIATFVGGRVSVGLIARLSWVVEADLVVSVQRPSFVSGVVGDAYKKQRVHEPSVAQLRANTGLEVRF